jgi:membrane protein implicated in regulation of membrane protease activity
MNPSAVFWLFLLVVFLVMESQTIALITAWFAVGALTALVLSVLQVSFVLQVAAFFVVSASLLALLRPLVKKYIQPKIEKTNVDAVIGSTGLVTVSIDNLAACGQVKLGGLEWTARSTTGDVLPAGTVIRVDRIQGATAYVSPAEIPATNS